MGISSPAFAAQICTLLAPLLPPHMYTRPLAPRSRRAAMILAAKLPSFGSALQAKASQAQTLPPIEPSFQPDFSCPTRFDRSGVPSGFSPLYISP